MLYRSVQHLCDLNPSHSWSSLMSLVSMTSSSWLHSRNGFPISSNTGTSSLTSFIGMLFALQIAGLGDGIECYQHHPVDVQAVLQTL